MKARTLQIMSLFLFCFCIGTIIGCPLSDVMGLTKVESVKTPKGGTERTRDWSSVVKLVANNVPGVVGAGLSALLGVGSLVMAGVHTRKQKQQKIVAAGAMKIVDGLKDYIKDFSKNIKLDKDGNGTITIEELKALPKEAWLYVKTEAESIKENMKSPKVWERTLRESAEILNS